ncbi:MAG: hypothetical protein IPI42_06720 [Saprospiraceae bacterium]|nr:hypothetical protein [Candidatus Parvibacillus calidus]
MRLQGPHRRLAIGIDEDKFVGFLSLSFTLFPCAVEELNTGRRTVPYNSPSGQSPKI